MRPQAEDGKQDSPDAATLALMALAWTLADERRADRLLGLTGLDADTLRAGLSERSVQAAVLAFLADHEPDLIACAEAIGATPQGLIDAKELLNR
jgi:hypothetical protein